MVSYERLERIFDALNTCSRRYEVELNQWRVRCEAGERKLVIVSRDFLKVSTNLIQIFLE